MESDGERQIAKLLEDNGYAYVPNPVCYFFEIVLIIRYRRLALSNDIVLHFSQALLVEPPPKKAYRKKDVE